METDLVAAILEADVALSGLLLVFIGFLFARLDELSSERRRRHKNIARIGMLPFGLSLWCAWVCVSFLSGDTTLARTIVLMFRSDLIVTGLFASLILFVFI